MVIRSASCQARKRGALMTELVVAMAILAGALLPLAYSIASERRVAHSAYQRAVAMEIVDGEMEALAAGGWRAFVPGIREYTVRAYVRSAELQSKVSDLSEEFRVLEAQAKSASPGQRYLLERKIDKERKETARSVMRQVAADVHAALAVSAKGSVREEVSAGITPSDHGQAILSASYLVDAASMTEFQKTLTEFVNRYQPSGFTFAFTGPWPPYHFVGPQTGSEAVG